MIRNLSLAVLLCGAAVPAAAATYSTTLSGANETLPNASPATGFGTLYLTPDQNTIFVNLSWTGLTAPAAAGHVHCCAAQGANAPVAIGFSPAALITGSLSASYDLTLLATYSGGFLAANGGTAASARSAFLTGLGNGLAYYNIHNANFPGGEIRGQLAAVPEPASWALMIAGFGGVGLAMRRRTLVRA